VALGAAAPAALGKLSTADARRQLDTAVQWGRLAALFEYDAGSGELILEASAPAPKA